jgi:HTH-type transcriptional regulator, sugar sensing transcriptional regulator
MLDDLFTRLGLSTNELTVYLSLLESGSVPAGALSKKAKFPRSSLYGFLENLTNAGLVTVSEQDGVKIWQANDPESLVNIADEQLNSWMKTKDSLKAILPELQNRQRADFCKPKFSYYQGQEQVQQLLKDLLIYRDIETELLWPASEMLNVLGKEFLKNHNIQRIRQNIFIKSIWPQEKTVEIKENIFLGVGKEFKREIRLAPKGLDCSMGYWAYKNKVAFVSSRQECFGFLVESAELREMLKTQFDLLWTISKPLEVPLSATKSFLEKDVY